MRMLWPEGERFAAHRQLTRGQQKSIDPLVSSPPFGALELRPQSLAHTLARLRRVRIVTRGTGCRLPTQPRPRASQRPPRSPRAPRKGLAENEEDEGEVVLG